MASNPLERNYIPAYYGLRIQVVIYLSHLNHFPLVLRICKYVCISTNHRARSNPETKYRFLFPVFLWGMLVYVYGFY